MHPFLNKIGRVWGSLGLLELVLAAIVLFAFIYFEEDWRGAHEWETTKAKWEAKGESFDPGRLIPPRVPDEQNIAALPVFQLEPAKEDDGSTYLAPVALKKALRTNLPGYDIPSTGRLMLGLTTDMPKTRAVLASDYSSAFKGTPLPDSALAQLNALFPLAVELLTAAPSRPLCRFDQDYSIEPPAMRPMGLLVEQINVAKVLTLHGILALHEHQANLAIADLKLNEQLQGGVARDPSLVAGLVTLGMRAISNQAIYDGLSAHAWNDTQLVELDQLLKQIDFLSGFQFTARGELTDALGNFDYFRKMANRSTRSSASKIEDFGSTRQLFSLFPGGWWDNNKAQITDLYFGQLAGMDPSSHRAFPQVANDLQLQNERAVAKWDALAPWNMFYSLASPGIVHAMSKFAEAQVSVDLTRFACALERYHLAHGVYPGSLDALAPAYLAEVPHDVMNGQPYHYQLRGDGTFLLYSVGWNQTDDGGKTVFKPHDEKTIDYENGDWVWPTPKAAN